MALMMARRRQAHAFGKSAGREGTGGIIVPAQRPHAIVSLADFGRSKNDLSFGQDEKAICVQ
jgi:hypothetical protein